METNRFNTEFWRIINLITELIEKADSEGNIEVDLNNDILQLIIPEGIFIINKQPFLQEIWLSSPVSGPYHFVLKENKWVTRQGTELFNLLTEELNIEIKDNCC